MQQGKNEQGWTTPHKGERSVRDRPHGLVGQDIWWSLQKLGFVNNWDSSLNREHPEDFGGDPKTKWEVKLKNWLIWGYWEENR